MGNRPATRHGDHGGVLSPAELDFAPRFLAPLDDKELSMSFHDHLIRQEQERRRASAWPQAVRQLSWFIRDYLRSEEHTSELQSLAYLVCRLLLEKKSIISPVNVVLTNS